MRPTYNIFDLDEKFLDNLARAHRQRWKEFVKICHLFNIDISSYVTPVRKYDPVEGETAEYEFPLMYHARMLYNFIRSKIGLEEPVEVSINTIVELVKQNPIIDEYDYDISQDKWINSRIGFLAYVANLKIELLEGKDFSATGTAALLGVTTQAILNRITRDHTLEAEKVRNKWVIKNKDVRNLIKKSDSFIM